MKVTGFSFIRNAILYDFPITEAIKSILPICDEFVVALGESDDETNNLIQSIDKSKIRIVKTKWDETLRVGGKVLAVETDKAYSAISDDTDWAFYIQGDEVVHEKYLKTIYDKMLQYKDDKNVDGLLFNYLHFYGSYNFVGASADWYCNEIRVVRKNKSIYSYRDAQGFRKDDNKKLNVKPIDAYIYHYGWVKEPKVMQKKRVSDKKYRHNYQSNHENEPKEFDFASNVKELKLFEGDHPEVMKARLESKNWEFDYDISFNRKTAKDKVKELLKKYLRLDFSYKNYKTI